MLWKETIDYEIDEFTLDAFQARFSWVSLGESRLRTETAGLYAVMLAGG